MDVIISRSRARFIDWELKHNEELKSKFCEDVEVLSSELQKLERTPSNFSQTETQLREIASLIKSICCVTQGFWYSSRFLEFKDQYLSVLKNSFAICADSTAIFISSLKCHQSILPFLRNGQKDLAIKSMAQITELANKIACAYKSLKSEFESFDKKALEMDRVPSYAIGSRRNIEDCSLDDLMELTALEISEEKTRRSAGVSAAVSMGKIIRIVPKIRFTSAMNVSVDADDFLIEYLKPVTELLKISDKSDDGQTTDADIEIYSKNLRYSYSNWRSMAERNKLMAVDFKEVIDQFENIEAD